MAICNLAGQSGGTTQEEYIYPSDWIDIRNPSLGSIELLVADEGRIGVSVTTNTGNYVVNWGDGTANSVVASGVTAEKIYPKGGGQACDRGYTTYKITITAQTGSITGFKMMGNVNDGPTSYLRVLACVTNVTTLSSLVNAFYNTTSPAYTCKMLEYYKAKQPVASNNGYAYAFQNCSSLVYAEVNPSSVIVSVAYMFQNCASLKKYVLPSLLSSINSTTYMFYGCASLQEKDINFSAFPNVTTATAMFQGVIGITKFDTSKMPLVNSAANMFNGTNLKSIDISLWTGLTTMNAMFSSCTQLVKCILGTKASLTDMSSAFYNCVSLKTVDVSGATNVTNFSGAFNGCISLKNIDISMLTKVNNAASAFNNCSYLETLTSNGFSSAATSLDASTFATMPANLENVNLSTAKVTRFQAVGTGTFLGKLKTLTFHASSLFSGSSPQIDIAYNKTTAAELDAIFTGLPTVSSKTIRITGCTGAATCTKTIATAKGWTVNSTT